MSVAVDRDQAFIDTVRRIAEEAAAPNAVAVDRDARFPSETIEALRVEWASALRFNNLMIAASEQAPRVCQGSRGACGIVGFKNDAPFSVGRHLRDTMSACRMVANERIHETNASLLRVVAKDV